MAKTRIRIEHGYKEVLDLTIEGLEQDVAEVITNDIFTTLQMVTELKPKPH